MFDPPRLFGTILVVVNIVIAVLKAFENKSPSMHRCLELAERVKGLASDTATGPVLERLKDAIDEAFSLIKYCQEAGIFSGNVNKDISNSIMNLMMSLNNSYNQPPCVGCPSPGCPTTPCPRANLRPTEHRHMRGGGVVLAPSDQSARNSSSAHPAFTGSTSDTHWASSSGMNVEWWEEHRLAEESLASERAKEKAAMNRAKEKSLASARAKEEAAMNRAKEESLASARAKEEAAMNHAKEESLALKESLKSARAKEEADMNCAEEKSLASARAKEEAAMNRAKEESIASARAKEEAAMNRAKEESIAWARAKEEAAMKTAMEESLASLVRALYDAVKH